MFLLDCLFSIRQRVKVIDLVIAFQGDLKASLTTRGLNTKQKCYVTLKYGFIAISIYMYVRNL